MTQEETDYAIKVGPILIPRRFFSIETGFIEHLSASKVKVYTTFDLSLGFADAEQMCQEAGASVGDLLNYLINSVDIRLEPPKWVIEPDSLLLIPIRVGVGTEGLQVTGMATKLE